MFSFLVININGNLVQIAGTNQTTTNSIAQNTAATVVQAGAQTITTAAAASQPAQLSPNNTNIVMVRNATDVRKHYNTVDFELVQTLNTTSFVNYFDN